MIPKLSATQLFEASIDASNIMSKIDQMSQPLPDATAASSEQVKQMNLTMPGSSQQPPLVRSVTSEYFNVRV